MKFKLLILSLLSFLYANSNNTDSLKHRLLNETHMPEIINLYIDISNSFLQSNIDSSNFYLEKVLAIQKDSLNYEFSSKNKKAIAVIYDNLAWDAYSTSSYRKSDYYFNKSLFFYKQLSDTLNTAYVYYGLAICNKYWGQYKIAVTNAQQGLNFFKEINNNEGIADIYLVLGYIYVAWGNFEQSDIYFDKVLEVLKEFKSVNILGYAILGKGNNFLGLSSPDSAFVYYNKALQLFKSNSNNYGIGLCYRDFARYYMQKNSYEKAIAMIDKSLNFFIKSNTKRSISELYTLKGKYFAKHKKYDKAVFYYKKAQKLALYMELNEEIIKNYKCIAEAYEKLNDKSNALKYFKRYYLLKDSIFTAEKFEQITKMQTKYETQKREQENTILKKELEIINVKEQESKIFQRFLFILLTVSVIVIILLYGLVKFRANAAKKASMLMIKEKQLAKLEIKNKEIENQVLLDEKTKEKEINKLLKNKHETELFHKNEELSSAILHLINKNETLRKIKRILITEKNKTKPDYKECDKKLLLVINSSIDIDLDWKKFMINFEKVHYGFMNRLLNIHTNLSENEQKLCAYLKINLSSQNIAQIMNITIDSVSKNRQRLRKKIVSNSSIDLKIYIQKL